MKPNYKIGEKLIAIKMAYPQETPADIFINSNHYNCVRINAIIKDDLNNTCEYVLEDDNKNAIRLQEHLVNRFFMPVYEERLCLLQKQIHRLKRDMKRHITFNFG